MESASPVAIIMLTLVLMGLGFFIQYESEKGSRAEPVSVSHLFPILMLADGSKWIVTILRRSGYEHSFSAFSGSRHAALDYAITKLRQARIDVVKIVTNDSKTIEVAAYFDSSGSRRTGKYIGGFRIRLVA